MAAESGQRYNVFLSHNSADKPLVEDVARKLRDAGVRSFLDKWHLKPGKAWQEELEEALEASASCAVCYGPAGISAWHNEELRIALEHRAAHPDFPVIPVILPGASKPDELPAFLRRLTWVDFREDDPDPFARLIAAIPNRREGQERAAPRSKPWNVPHRRNPYFTGREDVLEELHRALNSEGAAALGQAISGLGGIGKTQTAVEYAYRHRDDYSAVLWTRADTEDALAAGFVEIARTLQEPFVDRAVALKRDLHRDGAHGTHRRLVLVGLECHPQRPNDGSTPSAIVATLRGMRKREPPEVLTSPIFARQRR